jgi:hypothetical protein
MTSHPYEKTTPHITYDLTTNIRLVARDIIAAPTPLSSHADPMPALNPHPDL